MRLLVLTHLSGDGVVVGIGEVEVEVRVHLTTTVTASTTYTTVGHHRHNIGHAVTWSPSTAAVAGCCLLVRTYLPTCMVIMGCSRSRGIRYTVVGSLS